MSVAIYNTAKTRDVVATLQTGGSLDANTTYYVRIESYDGGKGSGNQPYGIWDDRLPMLRGAVSDEISFTTTTTEKQVVLTWSLNSFTTTGNGSGYKIYVSKTSGVYTGNCAIKNYYDAGITTNTYTLSVNPAYSTSGCNRLWIDGTLGILGFQTDGHNVMASLESGTCTLQDIKDACIATVGRKTFTGSGLNDLTPSGTFTGSVDMDYVVEIDGTGTPDTFKWSDDDGSTWTTGVSITGSAQTLNNGVQITFGATTGHTSGDKWYFRAGFRENCYYDNNIFGLCGTLALNWAANNTSLVATSASAIGSRATVIVFQTGCITDTTYTKTTRSIRIGTLNSIEQTGQDGCFILFHGGINNTNSSVGDNGNHYYYGCDFKVFRSGNFGFSIFPKMTFMGCSFDKVAAGVYNTISNIIFKNTSVSSSVAITDVSIYNGQITVSGTTTLSAFPEMRRVNIFQDPTYTSYGNGDFQFSNYVTVALGGKAYVRFYDMKTLRTNNYPVFYYYSPYSTEGHCYIYDSISIKILDEQGNEIEDADILITDKDDAEYSGATDANGDYSGDVLRRYWFAPTGTTSGESGVKGTWTDKNPFTIKISKSGYETYIGEMTLTEKKDLTITLKTASDIIISNKGVGIKADPTNSTEERNFILMT